jgi:hypothetical protein
LKKEFKYVPPPAAADEKPNEDGITDSMLEFSWERDVQASVSVLCYAICWIMLFNPEMFSGNKNQLEGSGKRLDEDVSP